MKKTIECKCTKCGEVNSIDENIKVYKCKYCNMEFNAYEAYRFYNSFYENGASKLYKGDSEFNIVNGILKEYTGKRVSVTIPDGVYIIDENAFKNNLSIKKVDVSKTCIQIGERAFYNCSNLSEINLPQNIEEIKSETFYNCINLISIDIPDLCYTIGTKAFRSCTSLKYVNKNYYKLLRKIEDEAFRDCFDLEYVALDCQVEKIGNKAFYNCQKLNVKLTREKSKVGYTRKDIDYIGEFAFYNCKKIEMINFSIAVKIGDNAFENCESLKAISFEQDSKIGRYAFKNCGNLSTVINNDTIKGFVGFSRCITQANAFKGTPILKQRQKQFDNKLCMSCNTKTKLAFNQSETVLSRRCVKCGNIQSYNTDIVLSSDKDRIIPYRQKKHLCKICGHIFKKNESGQLVCSYCSKKKDY